MGKHLEKRVFKRLQKTGRVCVDLMSGGRLFQSRLPVVVVVVVEMNIIKVA